MLDEAFLIGGGVGKDPFAEDEDLAARAPHPTPLHGDIRIQFRHRDSFDVIPQQVVALPAGRRA